MVKNTDNFVCPVTLHYKGGEYIDILDRGI